MPSFIRYMARADHNFLVLIERGHLGLRNTQQIHSFPLLQLAGLEQLDDSQRQPCLSLAFGRVSQTQVGKDVRRAVRDLVVCCAILMTSAFVVYY